MAIKTQQERFEELMAGYQPQIAAEKAAVTDLYAAQKKEAEKNYQISAEKTARTYDEQERDNAVQRLVNEHQIRADMEASGLSDSGFNRTQQTAVQLSYANQKAKIGRVRQQAIDGLTVALAQQLAKIDQAQVAALADIDADYHKAANSAAVDLYQADLKAETDRIKANLQAETDRLKAENDRIKAQTALLKTQASNQKEKDSIIKTNDGLLSYDFKGTLQENGVAVYYYTDKQMNKKTKYVDQNSGKTTVVDRWVNPFTTAEPNKDLFGPEGQYDPSRAFSNGYQPNNINGKKLTKVGTIDFTATLGRTQNVFQTSDGKFWVWSGKTNRYVSAVRKDGKWTLA